MEERGMFVGKGESGEGLCHGRYYVVCRGVSVRPW